MLPRRTGDLLGILPRSWMTKRGAPTAITLLITLLASAPVSAETIDISKPILCAVSRVASCVEGEECQGETPDTANLPRFLRVDIAGKSISGTRPDGTQRKTPIAAVQKIDNGFVLQGVDDGPFAWTLDIAEAGGAMTLAGIRGDVGFVVFGGCTTQ